MPIDYSIDRARRRVFATATGSLGGGELRSIQQRLLDDPTFDPSFSLVFDLTAVADADVSAEQIRTLAKGTAFSPSARRTLVVAKPLLYGLARMFQLFTSDGSSDVGIFTDVAAAEDWLDSGLGAAPASDPERSDERADAT